MPRREIGCEKKSVFKMYHYQNDVLVDVSTRDTVSAAMIKTFGTVTEVSPHPAKGHKQIELKVQIPLPLAEEEGQTFDSSIVVPELEKVKVGDKVPILIREPGD